MTSSQTTPPAPAGAEIGTHDPAQFRLHLENFTGPFDLLLSLINRRELDVTEVALAQVTDEFIAHIRRQEEWQLDQASEFLLIAATLLDLKAARLLPGTGTEDIEDLELLEARDLLFARLLQYRAYKEVSQWLGNRWETQGMARPRSVSLEPQFAGLLPELLWSIRAEDLASLAAQALVPKAPPQVELAHLHHPAVSVHEQAAILVDRLRRARALSFRDLIVDAENTSTIVARFLALLELFREQVVGFEQETPLGDLTIRWTGTDAGDVPIHVDDADPLTHTTTDPEEDPRD